MPISEMYVFVTLFDKEQWSTSVSWREASTYSEKYIISAWAAGAFFQFY